MSQAVPASSLGADQPVTPDDGKAGFLAVLAYSDGLELEYPVRLVTPPSWLAHTPFALWLVAALKPRVLVELGVHTGNSYCAFLQGVQTRKLNTRCFGIDHWRGDDHSGRYGDEIHEEFRRHHEPLYGAFSTLLRCSFDDAVPYFSEGSIDLLHIDGYHSYDAVAHDFGHWLPRMSGQGVVLLHDTNVRERGFGIWRFWEEIAARYPTFEFTHAHGLGLAYVGREPLRGPFQALFGGKAEAQPIRDYFARLGKSVVERFSLNEVAAKVDRLQAPAVLRAQLEAREAELEVARQEATRAQDHANALAAGYEARLADAARQIESQTALLRRRIQITAQLQQDFLTARRTIDYIFRSKSWRLTAPIRWAGSTLRKLLRRS